MAAIDKIYATADKQGEFRQWCKDNYPEALKYFTPEDWWEEGWADGEEHPLTNFPENVDCYLMNNCPIGWVLDRLHEQYGIA